MENEARLSLKIANLLKSQNIAKLTCNRDITEGFIRVANLKILIFNGSCLDKRGLLFLLGTAKVSIRSVPVLSFVPYFSYLSSRNTIHTPFERQLTTACFRNFKMTLATSQASEELQALQKRNDDRLVQQGGGNAATAFAKDVKQSLLFQYDWGELLSAAPICLSLMGACYVASSSPKANGMSLEECRPPQGFEFIRYIGFLQFLFLESS